MNNRRGFLDAVESRLGSLPEAERQRLMIYFADMLDDRIAMGMDEDAAVDALGDVDALIRDAALMPAEARGGSDYGDAIAEVRLHVKNADAEIVAAPLPDGMSARIEASASRVFTWRLDGGVLTVQEAGETKRGLFKRDERVKITLSGCRPAKLIADSYGGDITVEGLEVGETAVLAASTGDLILKGSACGGRVELTTRSGDIELAGLRVTGDCKLEALSGDVALKEATVGSLRARTASGDIECEHLRADTAALGATSGDIQLDDAILGASLLCETGAGDIDLNSVTAMDARLSSAAGDIDVRLLACPEGYIIDARSKTGDVDVPKGVPTGTPRRVTAVSTGGDITIKFV